MQELKKILDSDDPKELKALFSFENETDEVIVLKFQLWARKFFPKYFSSEDADFHKEIDLYNLQCYKGDLVTFVDIAFRGAAKTVRTKLFVAFCIANDLFHRRKYIKVLAENGTNSKQIVTDVYNMLITPEILKIYPEIFQKTKYKREETMGVFTTATGVKMLSDTVGVDQRGSIQEESRPDFIWFEDFENRKTLRSATITKSIWDNMEEARTGLAKGGSCVYSCNYISERGNVHTLVTKQGAKKKVLIIPIFKKDGTPAWSRYSLEEINQMREDDEDFEGERMCEPSASKDIIFDRDTINAMEQKIPIREVSFLKIYKNYDPSHRYALGADVAGGVGLDSSTTVIIDFDTIPAQVVATYHNNEIIPFTFGDEIARQGQRYGECLVAPEKNNHGHSTIGRLTQIYPLDKIYKTELKKTKVQLPGAPKPLTEYGWHTHGFNKTDLFTDLAKAVENGYLLLNCSDLIAEARSYTRNDLLDPEVDPRLTTRHFDLLTAAAIAWRMRNNIDISAKQRKDMDTAQRMIDELGFDEFDVLPR